MATAKKIPADFEIELTLSAREAKVLYVILNRVNGDPGGLRGLSDNIYDALVHAFNGMVFGGAEVMTGKITFANDSTISDIETW